MNKDMEKFFVAFNQVYQNKLMDLMWNGDRHQHHDDKFGLEELTIELPNEKAGTIETVEIEIDGMNFDGWKAEVVKSVPQINVDWSTECAALPVGISRGRFPNFAHPTFEKGFMLPPSNIRQHGKSTVIQDHFKDAASRRATIRLIRKLVRDKFGPLTGRKKRGGIRGC